MGADAAAEEQFGPYLVYERLGVGGMATVHRALERGIEGFERVVALKRLLPHLAADATFIKSFVREAKLASYLKHVNIVQLFELGRVGSAYFISMEYIDGRDIRRILRQARKVSGPPPIHVTVGLLMQLCDALDYAHHKVDDSGQPLGLVHRDVSPSNLLVTTTGQLKVIDFGIAKAASAQLRTQTGRVKGKLAYMAPEALTGKELDPRSDLFAAGVIAHELLTARPLFASKNEYQTLMKVQRAEVAPPSTHNPGCPPELDAIVLRALARDPDQRFLHASDLRQALHALRKQYSLQTTERDIVTWIDWAFSLEAPAGGFIPSQELDPSGLFDVRSGRPRKPKPKPNEDDLLDVAWSEGDDMSNGQPVLLPDVPDVSEKHISSALGADVRLDLDDLADDIPTPLPSHGTRPLLATSPVRMTQPGPVPAVPGAGDRSQPVTPQASPRAKESRRLPPPASDPLPSIPPPKATQVGAAASSAALVAGVRSVAIPPRVRTITSPPRVMPSASIAPRTQPMPDASRAAEAVGTSPRRAMPVDPTGEGLPPAGGPAGGAVPPHRSTSSIALPSREPAMMAPALGAPSRVASSATSRGGEAIATPLRDAPVPWNPPRGLPTAYSRGGPTDTADRDAPVPSPRALPSGSTAPRTRRPTAPGARARSPRPETTTTEASAFPVGEVTPPADTATDRLEAFHADELGLAADTIPSMPAISSAATTPAEPIVHFRKIARAPSVAPPPPARPGGELRRPFTPATDLFARPEAEVAAEIEAEAAGVTTPSVPRTPSAEVAPRPPSIPDAAAPPSLLTRARRHRALRRLLLIVAIVVGIAASVLALLRYAAPDRGPVIEIKQPSAKAGRAASTVRFVLIPADSAITIAGKPVHIGSPWDIELEPGEHQIEIHHDGYKGVLTSINLAAGELHPVQIELEKLSAAVALDAMPAVDPAPVVPTVPDVSPPPSPPLPRPAPSTAPRPPRAPEPTPAVDKPRELSDEPAAATASSPQPDLPAVAPGAASDSKPAVDESPPTTK